MDVKLPIDNKHNVAQNNGSTNTVFNKETRFDPTYVLTPVGMLKSAVIILNVLVLICILASPFRWNGRGIYFIIVAIWGLWLSGMLMVFYLFHVIERYHNVKWLKIEIISYVILTVLYLIGSTIAVAFGAAAYSAAGFFGYIAMVCYGTDAFLKAKALKAGELAQGHRVVSKRTSPTTPHS